MLTKPTLKLCYQAEVLDSDAVFLLSETGHKILRGELFAKVIPLLNGQRSSEEIIEVLGPDVSAAEVLYALMLLESKGFLVEHDELFPRSSAAFWHSLDVDLFEASRRLRETVVSVITLKDISPQPLISALQSLNITIGESGNVVVVLAEDYLQEHLAILNTESLRQNRNWMLVKPVGSQLWLGPILRPGKTACWECLAHRLRRNRPIESFIAKTKAADSNFHTSIATLDPALQVAASIAAIELSKFIVAGENPKLESRILTVDLLSLAISEHALSRRPNCSACSVPDQIKDEPASILLGSQRKTLLSDGGYRRMSGEAILAKYKHLVSPITGVVSTLQRLPDWQNGVIHNFYSGRNLALHSSDSIFGGPAAKGHSGGKGNTAAQAEAGALCEAVERYCWVFQGDEARQFSSFRKLGEQAIHPSKCLHFSQRQYDRRENWNAKCSRVYFKVPEPFDDSIQTDWSPVWSLTRKERRYIPTLYCYCDYPTDYQFCYPDTNGNAAGSCREEAILQGFLELVERDSVGIWWFNRLRMPAVDLKSFHEPYLHSILEFYETLGREIWVLDVTSDFGIPTFAAVSRRVDQEAEEIIFGFGAHLAPQIAVLRAITEMNQFLPIVHAPHAGMSVDYSNSSTEMRDWLQNATLANQPYLAPSEVDQLRVLPDYPIVQTEDLRDDVLFCVKVADDLGFETLILDQTRAEIGLNVVKVIVPGLRHFWRRVAPGRLYDVPIKMGWLKTRLSEQELNPVSVFF